MIDNPYSSFDIKGKVALVVGATGAFGSVAVRTYAGAGCKAVSYTHLTLPTKA